MEETGKTGKRKAVKAMRIKTYDTTLRDGTQGEGVAFSVEDKLAVARKLDELGIDYIEGGWPGSNVKDAEFFERARSLNLRHAKLAAFGSTCHARNRPQEDANLHMLIAAATPVVTIFGKTWDFHVERALGITLAENLALIEASVAYLKAAGREVIYDAEHFFDGFAANADYALATLQAAERGGADWLVLCDTNGGTVTSRLVSVIGRAQEAVATPLGIHTHNDSELAVANAVAAVQSGVRQVQGTINGYGERCGNANLCSILPILELKLDYDVVGRERLATLTQVSRYVAELANLVPRNEQAFVGRSAFAHKGGVHVSAVMRDPATYEHLDPELVGNARRVLVSDLSGKSNILYKAAEMGIDFDVNNDKLQHIVRRIKELEHEGFQFESAEASIALMMEEATGAYQPFFALEGFAVTSARGAAGEMQSRANVKIRLRDTVEEAAAEASGPVHALDSALRQALSRRFACLEGTVLTDYKVRVIEAHKTTAAKVRVLIRTTDDERAWDTVGVSDNILEASWQALADAFNYKLLKTYGGDSQQPSATGESLYADA